MTEAPEQRHGRRLSDKILIAFHCACDQGNTDIASQLLGVLESMTSQAPSPPAGRERRTHDGLVAAHLRLWVLQHPEVLERET
jgi:hypothetical protein